MAQFSIPQIHPVTIQPERDDYFFMPSQPDGQTCLVWQGPLAAASMEGFSIPHFKPRFIIRKHFFMKIDDFGACGLSP